MADGYALRNSLRCSNRLVAALLIFTVITPVIFFRCRLNNFGDSPGDKDFLDEESTNINLISDSRKLNAIHQAPEILIKEPIGNRYIVKQDEQVSDHTTREEPFIYVENSTIKRSLEQQSSREAAVEHTPSSVGDAKSEMISREEGDLSLNFPETARPKKKPVAVAQTTNTSTNDNGKVTMLDIVVRQIRDQLIRGRVYLLASPIRKNARYYRELKMRLKELQRALGEVTKDSDLSRRALERMENLEQTLLKAKQLCDDCTILVKKLRAMIHSKEEQLRLHIKQNMFLNQLAAEKIPKGLHCLSMRLATEYYALGAFQQEFPNKNNLDDNKLYHYALFSDNILGTAVAVNSTVSNAKEPEKLVFHVVTNMLNYAAMRMWFLVNPPGRSTIEVQNVDEFTWMNSSYSPVLKQLGFPSAKNYYFKTHHESADHNLKYRNPKYLSILNRLRFYLPQVFPKLNKVLFLDDDVVVQKDLTLLWKADMKGKVNGVVETCSKGFHRFDKYLNFSHPLIAKTFNPNACGWAYGMNIFDLLEWKRREITSTYHQWQRLNKERQLWQLGTLPPGLITFHNLTHVLDKSWHVLGLGYNPNVNSADIQRAAVIHYNGNMKPWLEITIQKYKHLWSKYLNYSHPYLQSCNLSE